MLFKVTTTPLPPNPQVKDTEFKDFFPGVNKNMAWDTLQPFVQQAEDQEIIPAIGLPFHQELDTEYQSTGSIADQHKAYVFRLLRSALAHYAMYYALPQLTLRVGDAGTNETSASDIIPTRQWVFQLNRWETLRTASKYMDMTLAAMEAKVADGVAVFDTWKNSDAYSENRALLIPNARAFQQYYNIDNSRMTYMKLQPYIRKAEQRFLLPLLDAFYTELSTQQKENTLSTENQSILPAVQRLLAEYTVILAIPDLNFVNDGAGWRVIENPNANPLPQQQAMAAVQQLHTKAEQNATHFEVELKNLLYANLDDYPTFRDSVANDLKLDSDEDGIPDSEEIQNLPPEPGAVIL